MPARDYSVWNRGPIAMPAVSIDSRIGPFRAFLQEGLFLQPVIPVHTGVRWARCAGWPCSSIPPGLRISNHAPEPVAPSPSPMHETGPQLVTLPVSVFEAVARGEGKLAAVWASTLAAVRKIGENLVTAGPARRRGKNLLTR